MSAVPVGNCNWQMGQLTALLRHCKCTSPMAVPCPQTKQLFALSLKGGTSGRVDMAAAVGGWMNGVLKVRTRRARVDYVVPQHVNW